MPSAGPPRRSARRSPPVPRRSTPRRPAPDGRRQRRDRRCETPNRAARPRSRASARGESSGASGQRKVRTGLRSGLARAALGACARFAGFLGAAVVVGETFDVVLAEVGAELHLDDTQRLRAGILEPVDLAGWDIDIAARREPDLALAERDQRFAARDDPLLGALTVPLEGELGPGPDENFFDLETRVDRECAEPAPGPLGQHVAVDLAPALGLQIGD